MTCLIMLMFHKPVVRKKTMAKSHKDVYEQSRESMEEIEKETARFLTVSGSSHQPASRRWLRVR